VVSSLTSDKGSIVNDGTDAATLTATVHDGSGNGVSGVTVNWSTTTGNLSAASSVTDSSGQATTRLTDTGDTGTATVTASLTNGSTLTRAIALNDVQTKAKMYCTSGASYSSFEGQETGAFNSIALYGEAGSVWELEITGNASFLSSGSAKTTLALDSTGYGLEKVEAEDIRMTVTATSGAETLTGSTSFGSGTDGSCAYNAPADNRTPACLTIYADQRYNLPVLTLTGNCHFADGTQVKSITEYGYASCEIYDNTAERVEVIAEGSIYFYTQFIPLD